MPNLYLIHAHRSSGIPTPFEYNHGTYDSAVVCARSEAEAKCIHPDGEGIFLNGKWVGSVHGYIYTDNSGWVNPDSVEVKFIGVAAEGMQPGAIVCASFNAAE
jgi:hypothetical protein